ncbi:unnamed protein product [Moneuplotes crassus]|uniref:Uncharacterized protein n=2 Tax=Euplotes crassus TaxID=5936 RepID=A0AAD2D974_EUPCR|nr:unnamed protein product [Moneuplotes crassus]
METQEPLESTPLSYKRITVSSKLPGSGCRYTINKPGMHPKHSFDNQKQREIMEDKIINGSKSFKQRSEVLLSHAINKSKCISAEILDSLDFVRKSPRRRKSPKVSPLKENLLDSSKPFLFTTKKGKKFPKLMNSEFRSRNTENVGLSMNTSKLTDNYSSITKVRNPSQMIKSFKKEATSFVNNAPPKWSQVSPGSTASYKSKKRVFEDNCSKISIFLKTLEMLSLHWRIIHKNSYRYRLKKMPGLKKLMNAIPNRLEESYYYDTKTVILSCKNPVVAITPSEEFPLSVDFIFQASKLQISLMNIQNFLCKIDDACRKYEKATKGFFKKFWNKIKDDNPIEDPDLQISLYEKLCDFDQNLRSLELAYVHNLKKVLVMQKERQRKQMKTINEEEKHILVKTTHQMPQSPQNNDRSLKNSASLASGNNIGSQTLTDAAVSTVIRKQTESGASDAEAELYNQVLRTDRAFRHQTTGSVKNKIANLMSRQKKLSQARLRSMNITEGESRLKSSCSGADNIGYIDSLKDERFNKKFQLKVEEDKFEDSDNSEDNQGSNNIEDSIRHLRDIRSRDFSSSITRSQNNLGSKNHSGSGFMFAGIPSNAVIQEALRNTYNNSKLSRKNYSKRTRVSVLDSSLSSLMKNSAAGDYQLLENQNKDPNLREKCRSSKDFKAEYYHSNTNPQFQFNKYKDINYNFQRKNITRKINLPEFNSPSAINSPSQTPNSNSRDINITPVVQTTSPSYSVHKNMLDSRHSVYKDCTSNSTSNQKPPRSEKEAVHHNLSRELQIIRRMRENSPGFTPSPNSRSDFVN